MGICNTKRWRRADVWLAGRESGKFYRVNFIVGPTKAAASHQTVTMAKPARWSAQRVANAEGDATWVQWTCPHVGCPIRMHDIPNPNRSNVLTLAVVREMIKNAC